jgi:hypothetical protein
VYVGLPGQGSATVTAFNLAGEKVLEAVMTDRTLDISALPGGTYLLQVRQNDRWVMGRFTKL